MNSMRACGWCGVDISDKRDDAVYCCKQHKKNAASKRHRERNPGYYGRYADSPARIAYREANRDRIRAYARAQQRQYRAEHPDAAAAWWAANPEKHRLYQAKRRAAKIATASVITEQDIRRLFARYEGRCAYCHVAATELDHVIPLSRGGRHSIGNLVPACRPCNASKNATLLSLWRVRTLLQCEGERLLAEVA